MGEELATKEDDLPCRNSGVFGGVTLVLPLLLIRGCFRGSSSVERVRDLREDMTSENKLGEDMRLSNGGRRVAICLFSCLFFPLSVSLS